MKIYIIMKKDCETEKEEICKVFTDEEKAIEFVISRKDESSEYWIETKEAE